MKTFENLIPAKTRAVIEQNNHVKNVISQTLSSSSVAHIVFCRIEGGRLRVTVDSAAWITKLRFSERQIIQALRLEKLDVHTASWHVAPIDHPAPRVTLRKPNKLTSRSASALQALATATTDNPHQSGIVKSSESGEKLRQELLKLAATLRE